MSEPQSGRSAVHQNRRQENQKELQNGKHSYLLLFMLLAELAVADTVLMVMNYTIICATMSQCDLDSLPGNWLICSSSIYIVHIFPLSRGM